MQVIRGAMPDATSTVHSIMEASHEGYATLLSAHWSIHGHFTAAPLFGVPPTGGFLHLNFSTILETKGALITHAISTLDLIELQREGFDVAKSELLSKVAVKTAGATTPRSESRASFLQSISSRFKALWADVKMSAAAATSFGTLDAEAEQPMAAHGAPLAADSHGVAHDAAAHSLTRS